MKTLKKLFAYLLAIVMCTVLLPSMGIVSAEENEIRLSLTSYTAAYNAMRDSDTLDVEFGNVCWREGDSATYEIEADEAGLYRFGINISGAEGYASMLTVTVNDVKQLDNAVAILHGNYFSMADEEYGTIWLDEGLNTVTIESKPGSAGAYATEIFFENALDGCKQVFFLLLKGLVLKRNIKLQEICPKMIYSILGFLTIILF